MQPSMQMKKIGAQFTCWARIALRRQTVDRSEVCLSLKIMLLCHTFVREPGPSYMAIVICM